MSSSQLLFTSIFISSTLAADYFIDAHTNCNNVYANTASPYVTDLGKFVKLEDCQNACISHGCDSYTYYNDPTDSTNYQKCYTFINNTLWIPYQMQGNIDCGRIIYKCQSDLDCSLNGKCNTATGNCTCNAGWTGYKCGNLNLSPATKGTGYNYTDNGAHTTSWGGSIQYNKEKNVYDMFVAEMQGIFPTNTSQTCTYINI